MPLSRLRLHLAGWFTLAFLVGLAGLSLTLFLVMHHQNDRRFTRGLVEQAGELAAAINGELQDQPRPSLDSAVAAALDGWPAGVEAFGLYDAAGTRVATAGPASLRAVLPPTVPPGTRFPIDVHPGGEHAVRLAGTTLSSAGLQVVVARSLFSLDEDSEALALWFLLTAPPTILASLAAGYFFSRRALRPVEALGTAVDAMDPEALDGRLPVSRHPDELDRLAMQFNALLGRLQQSRSRNQEFLQRAAHQIRTPLTLVLGETELALDASASPVDAAEALRRIRLAATQMRRRVEELLLLARADAGERAPLTDEVELDGLALDCTDLMRSRAQSLGCRFELTQVDPVVVRGSEPLLREALVELLENACRHGAPPVPIAVSVIELDGVASIEVVNGIAQPGADGARPAPSIGQGLGLRIVRWIAGEHGGSLEQEARPGAVVHRLRIPLGRMGQTVPAAARVPDRGRFV